jgi:hypothetical protein
MLEAILHIIGYCILCFIIDYDREEPLLDFKKASFWVITLLVVLASQLIKIEI